MAVDNIIHAKVDLAGGVFLNRMGRLFAQNDQMAHQIVVSVYRDGAAVDLSGVSVGGSFIRADNVTVNLSGSVNGNVATVRLPANCYTVIGHFSMIIRATGGGVGSVTSIFHGDGFITQTITGTVIDPENVLPTIEQLEAIIEGLDIMEGATAQQSGQSGLVPTPEAGDNTKFLRGDGEWVTVEGATVPVFSGATAESDGEPGLVPYVLSADRLKFLRGDGTWAEAGGGGGGGGTACGYVSVTIPKNTTGEFSLTYWAKSTAPFGNQEVGFDASFTFSDSAYTNGVFVPIAVYSSNANRTYGFGSFKFRLYGNRVYVYTNALPKYDIKIEGLLYAALSTVSTTVEVVE